MNDKLSELLNHLEKTAEEGAAKVRVHGRALSKGEDTIRLATETGLVDVPVSEIEQVHPSKEDPTIVTVVVRGGDRVRQVYPPVVATRARRLSGAPRGAGLLGPFPIFETEDGGGGGGTTPTQTDYGCVDTVTDKVATDDLGMHARVG